MKWPVIRYAVQTFMAAALALLLVACGQGGADGTDGATGESAPQLPQTAAERGLALVTANACTACHALDGTRGIGPGWGNSFGATRTFADGSTAVVDETYLRRSMLEPGAQVVASFDSIMLPAAVSEAQIADIIAFIKGLGSATAP